MNLRTIQRKLETHKAELKQRFHISALGIFGSYTRGEQRKGSDVDILVRYQKTPGFFEYVRAENYLSELLGVKVDLVMESDLNPIIAKRIASEVVML